MKLICNRFGALLVVAGAMALNGVAMGQVGQVIAWGAGTTNTGNNSEFGQSIVPDIAQSGITAIAGGYFHTIALKNGEVLAWGAGTINTGLAPNFGQCIIPTVAQSGVTAIAGGYVHTIALKNGEVLAWGDNYWGSMQSSCCRKIRCFRYRRL